MSEDDFPAVSPWPTRKDHGERADHPQQNTEVVIDNLSDKDSDILSEIDEGQFEDYDPTIEERPVEIDENAAKSLKAAKRKLTDGETVRRPKEGRRPKKRAKVDEYTHMGTIADVGDAGQRLSRKSRTTGQLRAKKGPTVRPQENEEDLTPDERRRRAIEETIQAALKNPTKRRKKKDDIELEDEIDEQIANLKIAMEKAAIADNEARDKEQPAVHKLMLLPKVTSLLNRTGIQEAVLDPETNFLQSVKFFLEPLEDGSLPAYNIQRDIFTALTKLPINKEVLLSSGIGKIVLFYTRSKKPEVGIKRMAERLLGEWSRPILKRTDDFKKRHVETREFDYDAAKLAQRQEAAAGGSQLTLSQRPAGKPSYEADRERLLAPEKGTTGRARPAGLPASYTIAPKSTYDGSRAQDHRPIGSNGLEAFRKMTQKKTRN